MSDETPPPPLRLKPRQRDETEVPPAAAAAEEGKLRLRPKLGAEAPVSAPAEPESPPPESERIRLKPKLAPEPEPEATETPVEPPAAAEALPPPPPPPEEGKIKLKIKLPGAVAQETLNPPVEAVPPAEAAVAEEPPILPPFPVVAPPPPEDEELDAPPMIPPVSAKSPPPPIPTAGTRPNVFKRPRVPAALLAAERRKRMWKYALIAVGGVMLAGAIIFGAFLKFSEPPPPVHIPTRDRTPVPQPTIKASVPEKVVTKPKLEPVVPTEAGTGTRVDSTATVELTPGVMATTESVKAVPNASSAFRTFVASARVSGVYQGTPPRAFINGRLVRTGEMIDSTMEIYFDSVDLATRSIVFKDSTGATVSRRY